MTAVCSDVEIVTGTRAGQLAKWRCDSATVVHYLSRDDQAGATWTAHDADISAVDILRCRNWLLSASDCTLRVWDLTSNLLLQTLVGHHDKVTNNCFSFLLISEIPVMMFAVILFVSLLHFIVTL